MCLEVGTLSAKDKDRKKQRGRRDKPWSFLIPHLIKSWSSEALAGLTGFGVEAVGGLYPLGRVRRSACLHLPLKVKSGWC